MENSKGERKRLHYFWPKNKNILFRSSMFRPREASGRGFLPERFVFRSLLAPMRQGGRRRPSIMRQGGNSPSSVVRQGRKWHR